MIKILIMGLPGAGKTTLAERIIERLTLANRTTTWLNADKIREQYNDWDFSNDGRIRQSKRMAELATKCDTDYVICDFVAPLAEMRSNFDPDYTIWVDTIKEGRFADTNKVFDPPTKYDFRVTEQDCEKWSKLIVVCIQALSKIVNPKKSR